MEIISRLLWGSPALLLKHLMIYGVLLMNRRPNLLLTYPLAGANCIQVRNLWTQLDGEQTESDDKLTCRSCSYHGYHDLWERKHLHVSVFSVFPVVELASAVVGCFVWFSAYNNCNVCYWKLKTHELITASLEWAVRNMHKLKLWTTSSSSLRDSEDRWHTLRGSPWKNAKGGAKVGAHLMCDGALDELYSSACLNER